MGEASRRRRNTPGGGGGGGDGVQLPIQAEVILTMRLPKWATEFTTEKELEEVGFKRILVFRQAAYQMQLSIPDPTVIVIETEKNHPTTTYSFHWEDVERVKAIPSALVSLEAEAG
jgi:hypothetical protein